MDMQWIVARVANVNRYHATQSIMRRLTDNWDFRKKIDTDPEYAPDRHCVYYPVATVPKYLQGKLQVENPPKHTLMPGYLFVRWDRSPKDWEAIRRAESVIEVITYQKDGELVPEALSDDWMAYIRGREVAGDFDEVRRILEAAKLREAMRLKKRRRKCRGLESLGELKAEILGEVA